MTRKERAIKYFSNDKNMAENVGENALQSPVWVRLLSVVLQKFLQALACEEDTAFDRA